MKFKSSLFLSIAIASSAFAQTTMYPGSAVGISANGQFITGAADIPGGNAVYQAYVSTKPGNFPNGTELPAGGQTWTWSGGENVNNQGNVAGFISYDAAPSYYNKQAAAWTNSGAVLHLLGGGIPGSTRSDALAINENNWIVGRANNGVGGNENAALWTPITPTTANFQYTNLHSYATGMGSSEAVGINSSNSVAGYVVATPGSTPFNAVVWNYNAITGYSLNNLHSLATMSDGSAAIGSGAYGISDNGSVVGFAATSVWNAALWNTANNTFTNLHISAAASGATESSARSINSMGTKAVGSASIGGARRASLWDTATGTWTDLNTMVSSQLAAAGFSSLDEAAGISDAGAIVGSGKGLDGTTDYGFLIDEAGVLHQVPQVSAIPEPTSAVLLGLAGMSFLVRRKRK